MTDTDKLREAIEFYDDSQDEQVSGEVHHNHLRSLVAAGRLVLASQSASGEVETAEAEYARWDTGYDSAIGGAFVGRLQDGFTWNAVSPGEHRGYDIVSVHTDHDLAGKERRSRALAAALTAAALWRQANGTGEIGRLKRRIDLRLNIVSRAFGEATATEQPAPQAAPAPIVEALCEAPQVTEARDLLGKTLNDDFGFWSSSSNERYRNPIYSAYKLLGKALASARAGEGAVVTEALCTFGPPNERKRHWILRFEDAEMRDLHFDDEARAHAAFNKHTDNWNCHLFVTASALASARAGEGAQKHISDEGAALIAGERT